MSLTPTTAPVLPPDVLAVGRAPVLVTGTTGVLGRAVVDELLASQVPVRALAHTRPLEHRAVARADALVSLTGNVATGAGLDAALDGVGAVIHCAGAPRDAQRVDVGGTRNLTAALDAWAPAAHLVAVSVVGCWENPFAYYRVKADAENVVQQWAGKASIVRATQFHPLVHSLVAGGVAPLVAGMRSVAVMPVDPRWVATKLVDVALMRTSLPEPLELAGPETLTLAEFATLTAHLRGRHRVRRIPVPVVGGALRAFAEGRQLAGAGTQTGGRTYAQWLSDEN